MEYLFSCKNCLVNMICTLNVSAKCTTTIYVWTEMFSDKGEKMKNKTTQIINQYCWDYLVVFFSLQINFSKLICSEKKQDAGSEQH